MPEVADSGEGHGKSPLVGGGYYLVITNRTARLDNACRASFCGGDESVREREESIAAKGAALEREARFLGLQNSDTRGVHSGHLACAYSQRAIPAGSRQ